MKIAFLHVLPLEYYPPARNALTLMSRRPGWQVRAWTSPNRRSLPEWNPPGVAVARLADADPENILPIRLAEYALWHLRAAAQISAWKPDALISVEPHSALAAWTYYNVFRGTAALFIHHHEYYAPEDFGRPGMRALRKTFELERDDLFARARWISQTNAERLRLLREWNPRIASDSARILPNYPTEAWIERARGLRKDRSSKSLRMIYVGSASFEDTFIREAATWAAAHRESTTFHVVGDNISSDVWDWLRSLNAHNITLDAGGRDYEHLPELLTQFDVGLVLYKANTLNFVHNVPNKVFEYLACGLNVWYPPQMEGMRRFHESFGAERLREVDFLALPPLIPEAQPVGKERSTFPFTCEAAMAPLFAELETVDGGGHP